MASPNAPVSSIESRLVPGLKLWLEGEGAIAMSDYRVRLLELVEESGSLVKAASALDLSYRRAWGKVKEIEGAVGFRVLTSRKGGRRGGGSCLTPEGTALVRAYRRFQSRATEAIAEAFAAELAAMYSEHSVPRLSPVGKAEAGDSDQYPE